MPRPTKSIRSAENNDGGSREIEEASERNLRRGATEVKKAFTLLSKGFNKTARGTPVTDTRQECNDRLALKHDLRKITEKVGATRFKLV